IEMQRFDLLRNRRCHFFSAVSHSESDRSRSRSVGGKYADCMSFIGVRNITLSLSRVDDVGMSP
ncbi:hypothetical protein J4734_05520, partial [Klebsiella pneumoniae]|nr:hypothetical protein [Klebsiella pneumoniae]